MKKAGSCFIITVLIAVFFIFREIVIYQYYQNSVQDKYAYLLLLPILLLTSLVAAVDESRSFSVAKNNKFWKAIKIFFGAALVLSILSHFFVVPFVSGVILFLNEKIGKQEDIFISGKTLAIEDDEDYSVTIFGENDKLVHQFLSIYYYINFSQRTPVRD
jgi:membrane protease YdiL (CAAX protease family)